MYDRRGPAYDEAPMRGYSDHRNGYDRMGPPPGLAPYAPPSQQQLHAPAPEHTLQPRCLPGPPAHRRETSMRRTASGAP